MTIALLTLTLATLTATATAQVDGPPMLPTPPPTSVSLSHALARPAAPGPRILAADRLALDSADADRSTGNALLGVGVAMLVVGAIGGIGIAIASLVGSTARALSCFVDCGSGGGGDGSTYVGLGIAAGVVLALGLGLTIGGVSLRSQAGRRAAAIERRALRLSLAPTAGGAALGASLAF